MNYYDIGCRDNFFDWIWILKPEGFERRRGRITHEIAWPQMDKIYPSGRIEQDTKKVSIVIPKDCGATVSDVISAIENDFGKGFDFYQFPTKG